MKLGELVKSNYVPKVRINAAKNLWYYIVFLHGHAAIAFFPVKRFSRLAALSHPLASMM
jgi:hypothetical protein